MGCAAEWAALLSGLRCAAAQVSEHAKHVTQLANETRVLARDVRSSAAATLVCLDVDYGVSLPEAQSMLADHVTEATAQQARHGRRHCRRSASAGAAADCCSAACRSQLRLISQLGLYITSAPASRFLRAAPRSASQATGHAAARGMSLLEMNTPWPCRPLADRSQTQAAAGARYIQPRFPPGFYVSQITRIRDPSDAASGAASAAAGGAASGGPVCDNGMRPHIFLILPLPVAPSAGGAIPERKYRTVAPYALRPLNALRPEGFVSNNMKMASASQASARERIARERIARERIAR